MASVSSLIAPVGDLGLFRCNGMGCSLFVLLRAVSGRRFYFLITIKNVNRFLWVKLGFE